MKAIVINILLFKLGWVMCVFGAGNQMAWLGVCAASAVALVHLASADRPAVTVQLLILAALVGLIWESALVNSTLLSYPGTRALGYLPPAWIVAMWVLFATTLNLGLRWLKGRWLLAAVFGAIGGPMGFWVGEQAGAVTFANPVLALGAIGAGWAFLMPLLMYLSCLFDGHDTRVPLQAVRLPVATP